MLTSCQLDALAGARVFLKCKNFQRAGVVLTGGNVEWLQPWPRLAGCGKTISARENFDGPHVQHSRRTLVQDAQKGCSARPQRVKQAEVEVKVEPRPDFLHLSLGLSLNLP